MSDIDPVRALEQEIEGLKRDQQTALGEFFLSQNKRMRCQPWKDFHESLGARAGRLQAIADRLKKENGNG